MITILLASASLSMLGGWIWAAVRQDKAQEENKKLKEQLAQEFEVMKGQRDQYFNQLTELTQAHILNQQPLLDSLLKEVRHGVDLPRRRERP